MALMNAEMLATVRLLCEEGVLTDARRSDEHEFRRFSDHQSFRRTIYIGCPDSDRLKDTMVFHGTVIGQKPHPIGCVHGGASAFHPRSLMIPTRFPYDYFICEIKRAAAIKNTRNIAFYSHTPCSAAHAAGLTVPQLIELQLFNRDLLDHRLNKEGHPMEVVPYFHVDYGNTRGQQKDKRTFLVSKDRWLDVRERFWTEHLAQLPFLLTELAVA